MLSLEKEQMEAAKAKHDVKLAYLRAEANNQQSSDEVDVSQKARLEVAKARHTSIVAQLNSVKKVLETMQGGSISLTRKGDTAIRRDEEALPLSNNVEKAVEVMILELITSRESLASVYAAYMEAEEQTIVLALATDEDALICGEELKQAEERILWLKEKILMAKNLKSELGTASNNLLNLQNELASYMIAKLQQESGTMGEGHLNGGTVEIKKTSISVETSNHSDVELEEVKIHTEEAEVKVNCLKVAATSLESALENEKAALASMKQREEMVSAIVSSLQAELDRTISEVKLAESKQNEAQQQMVQLPEALQQATREADEAKSVARLALEELQKVKEEATRTKASAITIEGRLHAVSKEIEALKASEGLALAAVQALEESERAANTSDSSGRVDLPLDEYYMLSNRARDAEESADERAAVALSRTDKAKASELRIFKKLQAMSRELGERKEAVWVATRKAEKAEENKLATEQEVRMQRSEHDQRIKKQDDVVQTAADSPRNFEQEQAAGGHLVGPAPASKILQENDTHSAAMSGSTGRKKRSLFPHLVTLFARKKA